MSQWFYFPQDHFSALEWSTQASLGTLLCLRCPQEASPSTPLAPVPEGAGGSPVSSVGNPGTEFHLGGGGAAKRSKARCARLLPCPAGSERPLLQQLAEPRADLVQVLLEVGPVEGGQQARVGEVVEHMADAPV